MKYFLHDTNAFDDEKVTELYLAFGYEGLGLFYTALEKIGKQEKPIKTSVLKAQLKVGKRLEKCWSFMEQIGIISSSNGESFNEQLLNFSEKYQIKKEKTRKKVSDWRERQLDKKDVTGYVPVSNPRKVKLSKVKESKGNIEETEKIPSDIKIDFIDQVIEIFAAEYESINSVQYVQMSKGKERSAAGKLVSKMKEKHPELNSEQTLESLKAYFRACVSIPDDWLQSNMSLSIIISKFNEINNKLKNGSKQRSATSAEQIGRIVDAYYPVK
jgi:hypothetical protein